MNIDLRNIDDVFEEEVKNIMKEKNIATSTKAVRYAVIQSRKKDEEIRQLKINFNILNEKFNAEKETKRILIKEREKTIEALEFLKNLT